MQRIVFFSDWGYKKLWAIHKEQSEHVKAGVGNARLDWRGSLAWERKFVTGQKSESHKTRAELQLVLCVWKNYQVHRVVGTTHSEILKRSA